MHGVVMVPRKRVEVSRFAPNSGRFLAPPMSGDCNEFWARLHKLFRARPVLPACCSRVGYAKLRPPRGDTLA